MKRWPLNKAYFWERAPFFRLLLPLIAGILLYPLWQGTATVATLTMAFCYLLFLAAAVFPAQNAIRRFVTFVFLHGFFIFLGFALSWLADVRNDKHWFGHRVNTADLTLVRISEEPQQRENSLRLELEAVETLLPSAASPAIGKALAYISSDKGTPDLHKGDTLLLPNYWEPITDPGNPHEFSYAAFCARRNIYYRQYLRADDLLLYARSSLSSLSFPERVHAWSMATLEVYVKDPRALGILQSMLLGDRANLDSDLRDAFAETGIAHLIAISGAHTAMLFFIILFLLRWLKHKKHLWLKYVIALPFIWFYVLMAGAPPSAIRAAFMFSLLALGFLLQGRRSTHASNHLFATAFIMLLANPAWLYSVGFQLSFVAVLSLILFYGPVYRWLSPVSKGAKMVWGTVAASIAAEVLIFPLVIYYFHSFPLLFILSNVFAYLLLSLVMMLGMLLLVLSFMPLLGASLGWLISVLASFFVSVLNVLSSWEPSSLHSLRLDLPGLLFLYLLIAMLALWLLRRSLQAVPFALAAAVLLLSWFCYLRFHDLSQRRLVVYNAGSAHHIEYISGNSYSVISSDLPKGKQNFVTKAARIHWQSLREAPYDTQLLSLSGQKVLILEQPPLPGQKLHADIIVLAYLPLVNDLPGLKKSFTPRQIVLARRMSEAQLINWKILSRKEGIMLHPVQNGGYECR